MCLMYYLRGCKQLIDRVVVFTGSKRDFEQYLADSLPENETTIPFMELIQHYNARLRPNESGVGEAALQKILYVDNCIVGADDYGSVMPHVLSNFVNIVTLNYQIGVLYVQNPPRRVLESLQSALDGDIEYNTDVHEWFIKNAGRYDNIRILKGKMENAIFEKLTEQFIISK